MRGSWPGALLVLVLGCDGTKNPDPQVVPQGDAGVDDAETDSEQSCTAPEGLEVSIAVADTVQQSGTWGPTFTSEYFQEGTAFDVEITSCDDDCSSNCVFRGPVALPGRHRLQRCTTDPATECSSNDDCGLGMCRFFIAAPVGGRDFFDSPTCSITIFETTDDEEWPVSGTIDLATGEMTFDRFELSTQGATVPCPTCVGDTTPNDDSLDGTCQGSVVEYTCDTHGQYFDPADPETPQPSSLDCLVNGLEYDSELAAHRSYAGITTAAASLTISEDSPDCGEGGGKCWCGICSENSDHACTSDSDCGGEGVCGSGYDDTPATRYDGCARDENEQTECDFDAGECPFYLSDDETVECGLTDGVPSDTVTLEGAATVDDDMIRATLVRVKCGAVTHNTSFDSFIGLPGLRRDSIVADIKIIE